MGIDAVEALPIRGNAADDAGLFEAAHQIAVNDQESWDARLRAIRVIDKAMGLEQPAYGISDVEEYAREAIAAGRGPGQPLLGCVAVG